MLTVLTVALVALCCHNAVNAQPPRRPPMNCSDTCPATAPYPGVTIWTDDTYRYVSTTTCPPYPPRWTNPGQACNANITYRMRLRPRYASTPVPVGEIAGRYRGISYLKEDPRPILGALGVLVNGVNIFGVGAPCGAGSPCPTDDPNAPTTWVDAVESEGHTFDNCGGHASPRGDYHLHAGNYLSNATQRMACRLPIDTPGQHSELLGWAFDGFGLYGRLSIGGEVPTDLDRCSGHTHEINGTMEYHYHLPDAFPWTIGCFKGCPDVTNNMRQLMFANNGSYGCPQGLDTDPGFAGTDATSGPTARATSGPTARATSGPTVCAFAALAAVLLVLALIM